MGQHLQQSDIGSSGGVMPNRNKVKVVNDASGFPVASGGTHLLEENTTYLLTSGTISLTNSLTLQAGTSIIGQGKNITILDFTGAGDCIVVTNANTYQRDFEIRSSDNARTAFNITNTNQVTEIRWIDVTGVASCGTISGGALLMSYYAQVGVENGITIDGTISTNISNCAFTPLSVATASNYGIQIAAGATLTSFRFLANSVAVNVNQSGLKVGAGVTTSNATILNNLFSGAGTRLDGIDANTTGWNIPSKSNVGIAGLFRTNRTIILGTLSSTTSSTWLSVTQQVLTRPTITDYEDNATNLKGILTVGMTHDANGGSVGYRLFNLTDGVAVAPSQTTPVIITTGGVYEVLNTSEFDLLPNKEYRVQIIKNSGTGGQAVYVNAGDLTIIAY